MIREVITSGTLGEIAVVGMAELASASELVAIEGVMCLIYYEENSELF